MRLTILTRIGVWSCVFALLGIAFAVVPSSVRAQTTTPTTSTGFTNTATSALQALQTGGAGAIPGIAAQLNNASVSPSATNLNNFTQILTALSNGQNISGQSAIALVAGTMGGTIAGPLGIALAGMPNLGNLSTAAGIQAALGSVSGIIQNLPANLQSAAIQQVIGLAGNAAGLAALAQNLNAQNLAQFLMSNFPAIGGTLNQLTSQIQTAANTFLTSLGIPGSLASLITSSAIAGVLGSVSTGVTGIVTTSPSYSVCNSCCDSCRTQIPIHYDNVRSNITTDFNAHRNWFMTTYWLQHILPALMLMAEQLTVTGIYQVQIIGSLLDAKHQLETQRLFQELGAQAHKDYQPSEGMCTFGSTTKSLAASERLSDLAQLTLSQRMNQRQVMAGDVISKESSQSDMRSRIDNFIKIYCDQADNGNGLRTFCPTATPTIARRNIDIDYTRNIESRLTLDMDFTASRTTPTPDEQDVFALGANLFSHNIAPQISPSMLADAQGNIRLSAVERYMDLRSIYAKRSVAQNSFSAITGMRTSGDTESAPYTKRLIQELGITNQTDIDNILGVKPSYFAQMEVLTKKLYQNPVFYTELYDKPVNVERKGAALQAIGLMQDRDLFNSLIRSEAVLSVLLETMLQKEQDKVTNSGAKMYGSGAGNQ